ncbi:terminase small subunit [Gilliamella apicola]|uniref:terminase small subunit n=1 Tax=Gilliamella apicola TaxID=1196095 RepID=UPI002FEDE83A
MTDAQKRIAAQHDYELEMKYKDIAEKYGVSINTVRSWKTRYKWIRKKSKKDVHTKTPTDVAINQLNNSNLKDKQKAFVLEYLRLFNATQAYINVYDVDYSNAKTAGPRLLENVRVQNQIKQIREAKLKELAIEPLDLIEDVVKEAKADIGNYLEFGSWAENLTEQDGETPVADIDGNQVVIHHSYLYFRDKDNVDTSLIKKITKGKDGATIELYDKTKARDKLLEWLKEQKNDGDTSVNINFDIPKEDSNASKS